MTDGARANLSGSDYEGLIAMTLRRVGYQDCGRGRAGLEVLHAVPRERRVGFVQQAGVGFRSLYGSEQTADFYLWHAQRFPEGAVIEVKYQGSSGSVDEKYPYTVACLRLTGVPAVLVLGGGGAKPAAVEWALSQADDRLLVFSDWSQFDAAANKGAFGRRV